MRIIPACLCSIALAGATVRGASAFTALQLLPPEQARNVAIIAGLDATPQPERWHFLVYDSKAENGLREVVVTGAKKTADRTVSQFAQTLNPTDVIQPDALKVDSDEIGKLALQFGSVNKVQVSALHFELRKSGPEASPLWTVTCLDAGGTEIGKLIISATRGTVIMHPGFEKEPEGGAILASAARSSPAPVAGVDSPRTTTTRKAPPRRRPATPQPTPRQGFLQRVFGPR